MDTATSILPESQSEVTVSSERNASLFKDEVEKYVGTLLYQEDELQNLYHKILNIVQLPLLQTVLEYTKGNQCKSAIILGISRNALRKYMQNHGLLDNKKE